MQLARAAAALAMVGFGQIRQFEIGGKSLGHAVGSLKIECPDCGSSLLQQLGIVGACVCFTLTMLYQQAP